MLASLSLATSIAAYTLLPPVQATSPASTGRLLFVPTADTLHAGELRLSLLEIAVPAVSYGVTDRLELTAAGTWVPHGEILAHASAKFLVDERRAGRSLFGVAVVGALGTAFPEEGGPLAHAGHLGVAMSWRWGGWDTHLTLLSGVPVVYGGVDAVNVVAPGVVWHALPWLDVVGEVVVRGVLPLPFQSGVTTGAAARFLLWDGALALDAGWMIDAGVIGPPLPIVSWPGIPVLSASLTL